MTEYLMTVNFRVDEDPAVDAGSFVRGFEMGTAISEARNLGAGSGVDVPVHSDNAERIVTAVNDDLAALGVTASWRLDGHDDWAVVSLNREPGVRIMATDGSGKDAS